VLIGASSGHGQLPVVRKPVIAILSTGDELVPPGSPLGPGQISASNAYGLAAVVEAAGAEARVLGIARDTFSSLDERIAASDGADILVTSGGASVGDHDLVRRLLGRETPFQAVTAVLAEPLPPNGPREHYMRGLLDLSEAPPRVVALKNQDSGLIKSLQRADCLVVVPADAPAQPVGSAVKVLKLDI